MEHLKDRLKAVKAQHRIEQSFIRNPEAVYSTFRASQFKSSEVNSNGDFISVINPPVNLYRGDQFTLHSGFIDNNQATQNDIILTSDTTFTFVYSYWNIDYPLHLTDDPSTAFLVYNTDGSDRPWRYQYSSVYSAVDMYDLSGGYFFVRATDFKRDSNPKDDDPEFINVNLTGHYLDVENNKKTVSLTGVTLNCRSPDLPPGAKGKDDFNLIPCNADNNFRFQNHSLKVTIDSADFSPRPSISFNSSSFALDKSLIEAYFEASSCDAYLPTCLIPRP